MARAESQSLYQYSHLQRLTSCYVVAEEAKGTSSGRKVAITKDKNRPGAKEKLHDKGGASLRERKALIEAPSSNGRSFGS